MPTGKLQIAAVEFDIQASRFLVAKVGLYVEKKK
jgi:hypothetical protein